jgi:hypothetical protein
VLKPVRLKVNANYQLHEIVNVDDHVFLAERETHFRKGGFGLNQILRIHSMNISENKCKSHDNERALR